jgi:hypothetical protein
MHWGYFDISLMSQIEMVEMSIFLLSTVGDGGDQIARILLGRGADPYWEHGGFDFAAWSLSFFFHVYRSGSKAITVNMKHRYISLCSRQ